MDPKQEEKQYVASHFIGLVLETILYGAYVILFTISMWALFQRRRIEGRSINPFIAISSCMVFVFLSIHVVASMLLRYQAYVVLDGGGIFSVITLANASSPTSILRLVTYALVTCTIDTILVYRLWTVWSRVKLIVILPAAATMFNLGACIYVIYLTATTIGLTLTPNLRRWTSVIFVVQALTNMACSFLLALRIVRNSMFFRSATSRGVLLPVLWIIVESAAIYTALTLCAMGLNLANQPMLTVLLDIIPPIVGITSSVLVLRVGLGSGNSASNRTLPSFVSSILFSKSALTIAVDNSNHRENIPLQVAVTRHAETTKDLNTTVTVDDDLKGTLSTTQDHEMV